jgi:hypothetical protein
MQPEELEELEREPPVELTESELSDWSNRQPDSSHEGTQACSMRKAEKYSTHTGGAFFAFCHCGHMLPPMELPAAESITNLVLYILNTFRDIPLPIRQDGEKLVIAYDDACHLLRFVQKRAEEPGCQQLKHLLDNTDMVVDGFHFTGHKGKFCAKFCNPYSNPVIRNAQAGNALNLSIAEQQFKRIAKHRHHMNSMNKWRFRFMLLELCRLDHLFRSMGLFG